MGHKHTWRPNTTEQENRTKVNRQNLINVRKKVTEKNKLIETQNKELTQKEACTVTAKSQKEAWTDTAKKLSKKLHYGGEVTHIMQEFNGAWTVTAKINRTLMPPK